MNDIQRFLSEFDKPEESGKKNLIATAIQSDYDKTRAMLALPALRPDQWDEIKDLVAYMQQQIQQYRLAQAHRHSNIQTVVSHRERPVSTKVVGGLIEAVAPTVQHATRSSRGGMFLLPTPELAAKKKAEGEVDLSTSLVDQLLLAESAKQKAPLLKRLRQMEDEWRAFQALADEL